MEGHIYIYGIISSWQEEDSTWGEISLTNVMAQVQALPENTETIVVHLRSEGGDYSEGFAIYDYLKTQDKKIITRVEGICASIATVIALAGEERTITENSTFMIHNPWTWGDGNAAELEKAAEQLRALESDLVNFYNTITGADKDTLKALMDAETMMDAAQAKEHGFFTEVINTVKAVAIINNKNNMDNKEIDKKFEGFFEKIKNLFEKAKALMLTSADGTSLDFGSEVTQESEIVVGSTATVDGAPAEGEYVMPDGRTLVFVAGAITEIKEAATDDETLQAENEALKAEIETLKAQNLAKEKELETVQSSVEGIKTQFTEFKAQIKSDMKDFENDKPGSQGDEPEIRKPFKTKE